MLAIFARENGQGVKPGRPKRVRFAEGSEEPPQRERPGGLTGHADRRG